MQQTTINGFRVMIFTGYDGTQLFINNPEGDNIYAHKVSGDPMERAREVIAQNMPAKVSVAAPVKTDRMICLSDRKAEFKQAMKRGLENDLEVYPDFEPDTFVVVNRTKKSEYRVRCETRADGKTYTECACRDFEFRKHICKHQAEVLQDIFFGVVEALGVTLNS